MTRRELKERDEITTTLEKVIEMSYGYRKQILTAVIVLVIVIGAFVGYRVWAASRDANAQNMLAGAIKVLNDTAGIKADKERHEKAIAEFQKVVAVYPSLPAAQIARYYIALSRDGLGDKDAGIRELDTLANSGDPKVQGIARFALAGVYKSHGDAQKAVDLYRKIVDEGGYSKSAALFELATVQQSLGQTGPAREAYQRIVNEFADSPFRQLADEALRELGPGASP